MARETDNAANTTEAAAKAGERVATETTKAGESVGASAAKAGERIATETTKAGERAGELAAIAGERVATYAANTTEAAAKAGERIATETADRIENASKAYGAAMGATFKAVQDYNTKLVQVFQTNAEANLRLGQTLMQTRSPADFVETMSKSVRERTELIAGQTKELAALGREATRRAIEAITPGR